MLVDVELTESENWIFLKYGRIVALYNPYIQGTTVPCDSMQYVHCAPLNVPMLKWLMK